MECVDVIFHVVQVIVQIPHTFECWLKTRDSHAIQVIQVRHKFVSVVPHLDAECLEFVRIKSSLGT